MTRQQTEGSRLSPGCSVSPTCSAGAGQRALWGWSPPDLAADTGLKRRIDRLLPRSGLRAVSYFAAVAGLLIIAPHLPTRAGLAADGLAALAGGVWCGLNLWRCRHAHCAVTSTGWLALSILAFAEVAVGHSVIGGYEQPVFFGVLVAGLVFECAWRGARGNNALGSPVATESDPVASITRP